MANTSTPKDYGEQLRRIEAKLDLLLEHAGLTAKWEAQEAPLKAERDARHAENIAKLSRG